jgi:hypothetical protein
MKKSGRIDHGKVVVIALQEALKRVDLSSFFGCAGDI